MPRRHDTREPRNPLLVLTSNEIETIYFRQMRRDCRYANMSVRQKDPASEDFKQMINEAAKLKRNLGYGAVWCVLNPFDVEMDPSEAKEYEDFARKKKISLVYNVPGIEFWFYLHYGVPADPRLSAKQMEEELRARIPGYESTEQYFKSGDGMDLHLKLFPNKAQAVLNANAFRQRGENVPLGDATRLTTNMPSFLTDVIRECGRCYISRGQLFEQHRQKV